MEPRNLCPFNDNLSLLLGGLRFSNGSLIEKEGLAEGKEESSVSRMLFGRTVILSIREKQILSNPKMYF